MRTINYNSKFMEFEQVGDTGKTEIWDVLSRSSGFVLGKIRWYGPWRQYCFFPSGNSVFNNGCMGDIVNVIKILMKERRMEP